ncbi:hypothetical protein JL107_10545 [Nakamurella flavida]|uniref:Uncharacterized protein n=1 Tax=Nakamurella flavida TaxID=363630 RepID=A0A938YFT9_9ACTN|nr:hypothetical protein [Nakamurella flavida]MBM9476885.1 hypothetical protein [Nakamurella flavida]MDP9779829.1 hypothetical protein [Nakamurella flavida]
MSALATVGEVAVDLVHRAGVAVVLAQPGDPDPSNGKGPEWGKAAPIGLLVIALLCIALFFLVKSMNKRIKRVPTSFAPAAPASTQSEDGAAAAGASSAAAPAGSTGTAAPAPAAPAGSGSGSTPAADGTRPGGTTD